MPCVGDFRPRCTAFFCSKSVIFIFPSLWDKMMLRKRYIIECINELLKNKANLVHSRHRSVHNFLMNLCAALAAYCFFENKPEALPVQIEKTRQLELFEANPYPELA